MTKNARQRIWPLYAPIGYRAVLLRSRQHGIAPDKRQAKLVRRLFGRYATGRFSLKQMADWAREAGLANRSGQSISKSKVLQILHNPIYAGMIVWNGTACKGIHRPLVSRYIWKRVQSLLTRKSQVSD